MESEATTNLVNESPRARRGVVVVHFDARGVIHPYLVEALKEYRTISERLILVSSSATELPEPLRRSNILDQFVSRANVGYDFCSWRDGLNASPALRDLDEVLFVNDSAYGPLSSLERTLQHEKIRDADMWGMSLSALPAPHIQSWFFAFRKRILTSEAFERFWHNVRPLQSKTAVVNRYEIGMSQFFMLNGFHVEAIYDSSEQTDPSWQERWRHAALWSPLRSIKHLRKTRARRSPFNHSELLWDRLWDAGVPFLKSAIFRHDHYRLNHQVVLNSVADRFPQWVPLITSHLRMNGYI